jgi:hypothetical protein
MQGNKSFTTAVLQAFEIGVFVDSQRKTPILGYLIVAGVSARNRCSNMDRVGSVCEANGKKRF